MEDAITRGDVLVDDAVITSWLTLAREDEHLEFKAAESQFSLQKTFEYCAALANEGGGYLVLGITDKAPRTVVGTRAFMGNDLQDAKHKIFQKINWRVEVSEHAINDKRVIVFDVPGRSRGRLVGLEGSFPQRVGESLTRMTIEQIGRVLAESEPDWFSLPVRSGLSGDDVVDLLDTQTFFEMLAISYPSEQIQVLHQLEAQSAISHEGATWSITNLGALSVAKRLSKISPEMGRRAPRVVVYEGDSKNETKTDIDWDKGLAVGFEDLVTYIHDLAPRNRVYEQAVRQSVSMFPIQALRELIANSFVHQDLRVGGVRIMIEMYADRLEISNPGEPKIPTERFIDRYRARNEPLTDLMRRLGVCEEKGSGIDKVVHLAETRLLPAPEFRFDGERTISTLFGLREFKDMSRVDRRRACYQHCCIMYVTSQTMTNESLRKRFGLGLNQANIASQIISDAKEEGLVVKPASASDSTRYAFYVPFWAQS